MQPLDFPRVVQLLEQCHGALMRVWNRYRESMLRLGIETQDALNTVALRCYERREQFRGSTVPQFCNWSRTILENWIRNELNRCQPGQFPTDFDADDAGQPTPSEARQDVYRQLTYLVARDQLTDTERALVAARYENPIVVAPMPDPAKPQHDTERHFVRQPNPDEVRAYLQKHHAGMWAQHADDWADDDALISACDAAWKQVKARIKAVHLDAKQSRVNE